MLRESIIAEDRLVQAVLALTLRERSTSSFLVDKIGEWVIRIAKLNFYIVLHRVEEILEFREA